MKTKRTIFLHIIYIIVPKGLIQNPKLNSFLFFFLIKNHLLPQLFINNTHHRHYNQVYDVTSIIVKLL